LPDPPEPYRAVPSAQPIRRPGRSQSRGFIAAWQSLAAAWLSFFLGWRLDKAASRIRLKLTGMSDEEGHPVTGGPSVSSQPAGASGERRLADSDQQVMADFSGEHVVNFLEPGKLGLQVMHTLLKATHL
jgi:hypothetical protein